MDMPPAPRPTTAEAAVQWRPFLRALADEVDSLAGPNDRDEMLRNVGRRMARALPVPSAGSLETLEIEMNDVLAMIGWGSVHLSLNEAQRSLILTHAGLPRVGSAGSPPGTWLAALLEGLYETWLAQQPGSDPNLTIRRDPASTGSEIVLRFGRG